MTFRTELIQWLEAAKKLNNEEQRVFFNSYDESAKTYFKGKHRVYEMLDEFIETHKDS